MSFILWHEEACWLSNERLCLLGNNGEGGENASTPNIGTAGEEAVEPAIISAAAAAAAAVNVMRVRDAGACCDLGHIMYVFLLKYLCVWGDELRRAVWWR